MKTLNTGLIASYIISNTADWMCKIALPILIFELTQSTLDVSFAYMLIFLPFLMVSLIAGTIANTLPVKYSLISAESLSVLGLLGISASLYYPIGLPWIYLLIFIVALGAPLKHALFQTAIGWQVDKEQLARVNAIIASTDNILLLSSPLITGVLLAAFGTQTTVIVIAAFYLSSAFSISLLFTYRKAVSKGIGFNDIKNEIPNTLKFLKKDKKILSAALLFFFSNFSIHFIYVNFIYIFIDKMGFDYSYIAYVYAGIGVGALLGCFLAPYLSQRYPYNKLISFSTMAAAIMLVPALYTTHPYAIIFCWLLSSIFGAINMVVFFTMRHHHTPKNLLTSVVSLTRLLAFSSIPIAAVLGGVLAQSLTIQMLIAISISIRLFAGMIFYIKIDKEGNKS